MARSLRKILVANRGEIALRVVRACRDAGLSSVAVYAEVDEKAPYVRFADERLALHGDSPTDTYLNIDQLVEAAAASGSDAVHPGYGFLSENATFAQAVIDAGLVWVGPGPAAIRLLGDKVAAREVARRVGAPLAAGSPGPVADADEIAAFVREHGLPVAIKAVYGGGGRGLRVVRNEAEIIDLFQSATREAEVAFGNGACFVERYLDCPRHVEAQVLADEHGNVVVIGTRDCSLQRRHQKLVEEAPAPFLSDDVRERIHSSAKAICKAAGYSGAGTVEYLVTADGTVSFLEVNTRLQVEHPVSEETAGVDLVREQLRIASGECLRFAEDPPARGHSIEFRINGEDPARNFLPAPGKVSRFVAPGGPGVRVDSGVESGSVLAAQFDSLLAKVIVTGEDRNQALERARRVLDEMEVDGVATVLPFHRTVVRDPAFVAADGVFGVHTHWIESEFDASEIAPFEDVPADSSSVGVKVGGRSLTVSLPGLATLGDRAQSIGAEVRGGGTRAEADGATVSPMQGTVVKVMVSDGDLVEKGDVVAVVEAMKMENPVLAPRSGTVTGLKANVGVGVSQGELLCTVEV